VYYSVLQWAAAHMYTDTDFLRLFACLKSHLGFSPSRTRSTDKSAARREAATRAAAGNRERENGNTTASTLAE
jgi:hypothetical protein